MTKISLRDMQLSYDGEKLTVSSQKHADQSITLSGSDVEELVQFVETVAKTERDRVNRRESYRVPILPDSGVELMLRVGGVEFKAMPRNISMTGIFVVPRSSEKLKLMIDDRVNVYLSYGDQSMMLNAIVKRYEEGGYGLFFPSSMRGEYLDPPALIRRIVMELQRQTMVQGHE